MKSMRKFTIDFKKRIIEEVESGILTVAQAMRKYELSPSVIYRWKQQYKHGKLNNIATEIGKLENEIAALQRKIGEQTMEIDVLKKVRDHYRQSASEKSLMNAHLTQSKRGAK
jgi:transposase